MIYPSRAQFLRWTRIHNVVPFWAEIPAPMSNDLFPSFQNFAAWDRKSSPLFFFDSFNASQDARFSFYPLSGPEGEWAAGRRHFPKTWSDLGERIARKRGPVLPPSLPPFYGGWAGILSYDAGRFFEPGWRGAPPPDPLRFPWMRFGYYPQICSLDHARRKIYVFSCLPIQKSARQDLYQRGIEGVRSALNRFQARNFPPGRPRSATLKSDPIPVQGNLGWYLRSVRKIKKWIAQGDIYQANLSQRLSIAARRNGLALFSTLRQVNPSPYACYWRLGGTELVSCSPELLLKKRGEVLETRPIAGTRPRGRNARSDRRLQGELLLSPKERAEHIMLVDLERNDLGRVARSGSVRVSKRMVVEKYSHVMHIVSHVRGRARPGVSFLEALAALFPGGTITGCPKIRCMEILDALEPVARGPFFGSTGWIGFQGDGEMNLLIRTALVRSHRALLQAGGGIVADSDPESEYRESLHKARALVEAAGALVRRS